MPVGAGGRGQDLAGLQNDADHPPAHQAPPVWRVPEGPEGLAGLRDRRLRAAGSRMEGTARPAWPAEPGRGAGGSGGLGQASRSTTPSRRFTHGGNREARVARGAGPRCRWAAAELGQASRSTTPSRRLACGDLAGGRTRRHPEHPWGHKQQATSETGRAAAHRHTAAPHNETRPRPVSRPRPRHSLSATHRSSGTASDQAVMSTWSSTAARPASRRATGTRNGEQDT